MFASHVLARLPVDQRAPDDIPLSWRFGARFHLMWRPPCSRSPPPTFSPGHQVLGLFVGYMLEVVGLPSPLAILATVPFAGTRPDLS